MLFDFLEKLRSKPKEVRQQYTVLFSGGATLLIVLVWVLGIMITSYGARGISSAMVNEKHDDDVTIKERFDSANLFLENDAFNEQMPPPQHEYVLEQQNLVSTSSSSSTDFVPSVE